MSNSVRPHRRQPTRLPSPWDSPGKNTGVGCHFLLQCMQVKSQSEVTQSCSILSDPMECSLPGSSIHGIFQARVLEWGAIAFCIPAPQSLNNPFHCVCKNLITLPVTPFISFTSKKDINLNLNLPDKNILFYNLLTGDRGKKLSPLCCHLYLEVRTTSRWGRNGHSASLSTSCSLFLLVLFKWPPYIKISVILESGLFLISQLPFTVLQDSLRQS